MQRGLFLYSTQQYLDTTLMQTPRVGFGSIAVLETEEGLLVIDPMNPEMSTALRQELDIRFPERKVHTLVYSP